MINSLGSNVDDSFKAIVNGECGIDTITLFDASEFGAQIAGEVKNFDTDAILGKKESKKQIDLFTWEFMQLKKL